MKMRNINALHYLFILFTVSPGDVSPAMRAIAQFVAQPSSSTDGALSVVEHPAAHIALKKIIANDKTRMEAGDGSECTL